MINFISFSFKLYYKGNHIQYFYKTIGPVVIVTNWPDFDTFSTVKQLSEHSNNECVLLHVDADLLLFGVFSWSSVLGMWPNDFECLGGLGGGALSSSGLDSLLHETAVGNWLGRNLWGSMTFWTNDCCVLFVLVAVRSVQDSTEEIWLVARDLKEFPWIIMIFLYKCTLTLEMVR